MSVVGTGHPVRIKNILQPAEGMSDYLGAPEEAGKAAQVLQPQIPLHPASHHCRADPRDSPVNALGQAGPFAHLAHRCPLSSNTSPSGITNQPIPRHQSRHGASNGLVPASGFGS